MSENKESDDHVEMDDSFSPQFVREVTRIKSDIKKIVEDNFTRDFFRPLCSNLSDATAILRVQFNNTVEKMEEKEKQSLVKELIKLVHHAAPDNSHTYVGTNYERVVDELFQYAYKKEAITTPMCTEGLIMTTDFRHCRVDQTKWRFIRECIPKIDYKGIRNILRYILESQIRRLPFQLSAEQINELRIVEDVILYIIDRQSNLLPPLITLSEIMRGVPRQAHMFPRLTEKLTNFSVYFRPIADMTYMCGRSFIYPIPLNPAFFPQHSFWEDGVASINSFVQAHHTLPYRLVHENGNLYTLYMIMRQPMGKDSFKFASKSKVKSNWDILISIMICEAMAAAEALPEHEPIPRYQWDNIVNLVNFGLLHHLLNPKNFFQSLKGLIKSCKYMRARDEVMWIVLQIVSSLANAVRIDDSVQEIVNLYHDLYDGDVVWMGASDHPAVFARFLAAASTWMYLDNEYRDKLPAPNETIQSHIKFIKDGAENFDKNNTAMLAVLANVFLDRAETKTDPNAEQPKTDSKTDSKIDSKLGKQIIPALAPFIEAADESNPIFELSYRRTAVNSFSWVPQEFLDALTFRSKKSLLSQCLSCLRKFGPDKLPGPSVFESIARLCQSEDYEMAIKEVEVVAQRSLHIFNTADSPQARDQCYFLFDFLTYRIPHLPSFYKYNSPLTTSTNVVGHFTQHSPNTSQNHQLYRLMEHFLMRRYCWTGFHECIVNHSALLAVSSTECPLTRYLLHPKSFTTPVDSTSFPVNPEMFKMSLYAFFRAMFITDHEIRPENSAFPHLIAGYRWPSKSTFYFPEWAQDIIETKDFSHLQPNFDDIVATVDEALDLQRKLSQHQFLLRYGDDSDTRTIHCMLAVIFKFAFDSLDTNMDLTSEFFEVIDKRTPKDIVIMGNYMVDYIIAFTKSQDHNDQLFKNVAKACARVVFEFQVMRADRLLLALTMHPGTDEDALICVQISNEFLLTPELQERIKWFHCNGVLRKECAPTEYMKAVVKYHDMYPEFEACQLVTKNEMKANIHMPNYYGNLIERMLPILDHWMYVALEQQGYKLNQNVLQVVAMFYRYHPMPIHFMYTVLFMSHGKMSRPEARSFVLKLTGHMEDVHLTEAFVKYNHQKSSKESFIMELLDRMAASLDFILVPPSFVAKDWKTAEMSPGAQTLFSACIELMASPHSPEDLVAAMINVMQMKPHLRPYNVVNLIANLLTALPSCYAAALHQECCDAFDRGDTAELTFEEIVFDNFEEYQLVNITNRTRSLNVISQAYWTQCPLRFLTPLYSEYVPMLLKHVKTEKDLWYTLRLVTPTIRRYWDNWDIAKQMRTRGDKFGPLSVVKQVIVKLGSLAEQGVEFKYQAQICDFFYNCKYQFAGDFLRDTAMTEFAKFPEEMRNRLKFYVSQSEPPPLTASPEKEKTPEKEKANEPVAPPAPAPAPPQPQWAQQPHQQAQPVQHHHHQQPQHQPPPQQHHQIPQQHPIAHQPPQAPPPQMQHHLITVKQEPRHFDDEYQAQQQQRHMMQQQSGSHMELHHQMPEHQGPPQSVQMHMTPQYPGMGGHHHQMQQQQMHQMHQMQYGMHHHHPNHPTMQQQMHPAMNNMTPQQYAYMMQMQQMQHQQQQHQQHNQYMHHNQQMQ